MYTYKTTQGRLGGYETHNLGDLGICLLPWPFKCDPPTAEEYAERDREAGLVESDEARARREAANAERVRQQQAQISRTEAREEALVNRAEVFAEERAKEAKQQKIITAAAAIAVISVVWFVVIKMKG